MKSINFRVIFTGMILSLLTVVQSVAEIQDQSPLAPILDNVNGVRFVHGSTLNNTINNLTLLDHPLINDNPDAIIFVTQNQTPGGIASTPVEQNLGVYYSNSLGQWAIFDQNSLHTMPIDAVYNILVPDPAANVFVHVAKSVVSHTTVIDHPLTNTNPDALLYVTQNWNPGGVGGTYNDQPVGVSYSRAEQKWTIQNASKTSKMPEGAAFNVLVAEVDMKGAFTHITTAADTDKNWTIIDHPLTNNNPNALLYFTSNRIENVQTCQGIHPSGVGYITEIHKWGIYTQNEADLPSECIYNIIVPTNESDYFVHEVTISNNLGTYSLMDNALVNNKPFSFLFITHNNSPGGVVGALNNHPIGIQYLIPDEKWIMRYQDFSTFVVGSAFNVLIAEVDARIFLHQATISNKLDNYSIIDYPITNNNPGALLFISQNWNPGTIAGVLNISPVAVFYNSSTKWGVINLQNIEIPTGAFFNVLVLSPSYNVFVHESSTLNISGDRTFINHPLTNNNPNALVYITRNINPGEGGWGPTHNHVTGVVYDATEKKWAIFNHDGVDMPIHVAFNVLVMADRINLPVVMR